MNSSETKSSPAPETAAGGCCGLDRLHTHGEASQVRKPHPDHVGCGTSKTTEAAMPADKPKAAHGSGCCCS